MEMKEYHHLIILWEFVTTNENRITFIWFVEHFPMVLFGAANENWWLFFKPAFRMIMLCVYKMSSTHRRCANLIFDKHFHSLTAAIACWLGMNDGTDKNGIILTHTHTKNLQHLLIMNGALSADETTPFRYIWSLLCFSSVSSYTLQILYRF